MEQEEPEVGPELLVAVLNGEASPEDRERVQAWREADLRNEARFQELSLGWEGLALLEVRPGMPPRTVADVLRSSSGGEGDEGAKGAVAGPRPYHTVTSFTRPSRILRTAALAAALVVGMALGIQIDLFSPASSSGAQEVVTDQGQQATVRLADGTVVRLAPGSRLQVPSGEERQVALEGRAYFAVAPSEGRRFRVDTSEGSVVVYGTRFDVAIGEDGLDVVVVEGQVALESDGGRVELSGSQGARVRGGLAPEVRAVDDVYAAIAWTGGFLAFEATPLREAVLELEQRFRVRLRVQDPELMDRSITGWFVQQDPGEVVAAVCAAVDAVCVAEGDSVLVSLPVTP